MGNMRMGPPEELVLLLKERCGVRCFVETGTFRGDTTAWAAERFDRVVTIEGAESFHQAAVARFTGVSNVECRHGDSRQELQRLAPTLSDSAIFWLDAHWCGEQTFGRHSECPLLEEIAILDGQGVEHLLLIDDARLFLSPPPKPHRRDDWPDLARVVEALRARFRDAYIVVFEDVIVRVPNALRDAVSEFCQTAVTEVLQNQNSEAQRRQRLESRRLYRLARRMAQRVFR